MENQSLKTFLSNLDLTDEESVILYTLIQEGESTVFKLGEKTGVIRTTIYRALDRLHKRGLVVYVPNEKRKMVKAANFDAIADIVEKKKEQMDNLINLLPDVQALLTTKIDSNKETKVYYYRGSSGIRQLQWNMLSKGENCYAFFSERYFKILDLVGRDYEKKWMKEFQTKNFKYKGITTTTYKKEIHKKDPEMDKLYNRYLEIRTIPQKVLKITNEMRIYGDTLAFYNLEREDVTGVEIINKDIAAMLKQMFDMYWGLAE